jgi:hypothetical protein
MRLNSNWASWLALALATIQVTNGKWVSPSSVDNGHSADLDEDHPDILEDMVASKEYKQYNPPYPLDKPRKCCDGNRWAAGRKHPDLGCGGASKSKTRDESKSKSTSKSSHTKSTDSNENHHQRPCKPSKSCEWITNTTDDCPVSSLECCKICRVVENRLAQTWMGFSRQFADYKSILNKVLESLSGDAEALQYVFIYYDGFLNAWDRFFINFFRCIIRRFQCFCCLLKKFCNQLNSNQYHDKEQCCLEERRYDRLLRHPCVRMHITRCFKELLNELDSISQGIELALETSIRAELDIIEFYRFVSSLVKKSQSRYNEAVEKFYSCLRKGKCCKNSKENAEIFSIVSEYAQNFFNDGICTCEKCSTCGCLPFFRDADAYVIENAVALKDVLSKDGPQALLTALGDKSLLATTLQYNELLVGLHLVLDEQRCCSRFSNSCTTLYSQLMAFGRSANSFLIRFYYWVLTINGVGLNILKPFLLFFSRYLLDFLRFLACILRIWQVYAENRLETLDSSISEINAARVSNMLDIFSYNLLGISWSFDSFIFTNATAITDVQTFLKGTAKNVNKTYDNIKSMFGGEDAKNAEYIPLGSFLDSIGFETIGNKVHPFAKKYLEFWKWFIACPFKDTQNNPVTLPGADEYAALQDSAMQIANQMFTDGENTDIRRVLLCLARQKKAFADDPEKSRAIDNVIAILSEKARIIAPSNYQERLEYINRLLCQLCIKLGLGKGCDSGFSHCCLLRLCWCSIFVRALRFEDYGKFVEQYLTFSELKLEKPDTLDPALIEEIKKCGENGQKKLFVEAFMNGARPAAMREIANGVVNEAQSVAEKSKTGSLKELLKGLKLVNLLKRRDSQGSVSEERPTVSLNIDKIIAAVSDQDLSGLQSLVNIESCQC